MIIECPDCLTKFVVPAAAIGPEGRMVRCAKCQNVWHSDPAPDDHEIVPTEVVPEPEPTPEPEPVSEEVAESVEDKVNVEEEDIPTEDKVGPDGIPGEDLEAADDGRSEEEVAPVDVDEDESPHDEDGDLEVRLDDEDEDDDINLPAVVKDRSIFVKIGWGLWAAVFFGTILTFVFAKSWMQDTWPQSTVLYDLVGMGDNRTVAENQSTPESVTNTENTPEAEQIPRRSKEELTRAIVNTNTYTIETIGGGRRDLIITGSLRSSVDYDIELPDLKGELKNSEDVTIHEWIFTVNARTIKAGETINYRTAVANMPAGTAAFEVFLLFPDN